MTDVVGRSTGTVHHVEATESCVETMKTGFHANVATTDADGDALMTDVEDQQGLSIKLKPRNHALKP